jgi:hypothetical protein
MRLTPGPRQETGRVPAPDRPACQEKRTGRPGGGDQAASRSLSGAAEMEGAA